MIHAVRTLHQVVGRIQSVTDGAPVAGIEHHGLSSTSRAACRPISLAQGRVPDGLERRSDDPCGQNDPPGSGTDSERD